MSTSAIEIPHEVVNRAHQWRHKGRKTALLGGELHNPHSTYSPQQRLEGAPAANVSRRRRETREVECYDLVQAAGDSGTAPETARQLYRA